MKFPIKNSLAAFLSIMFSFSLWAHSASRTEIGVQAGWIFIEGDNDTKDDFLYGGRIGRYMNSTWSIEGNVLAAKADIKNSNSDADLLVAFVEGQYHLLPGAVRPFLAAGVGVFQTNRDRQVAKNERNAAIPVGAGIKWFFHPAFCARADGRLLLDTESGRGTYNGLMTVGLSWLFGDPMLAPAKREPMFVAPAVEPEAPAAPAAPVVVDSDGDGIYDDQDQCPGTPAGVAVDERGCPKSETQALPKDDTWVLRGIQFEVGSDKLKPGSMGVLSSAVEILKANPVVRVLIAGHSDSTGSKELNLTLSQKRADSVKNYLVEQGVSAARLETKGYGDERPIADNSTADGRALNRRIEFNVLSR